MNLQTNRYNTMVPTAINTTGTAISVPFYIQPTTDQKKALLNAFRVEKQKQLLDMGFDNTRNEGRIVVLDSTKPPQTPIEMELGINEENLRLMLFSRQGIQERLILQIQKATGVTIFTKEEVIETYTLWINHLFDDDEPRTKATTKASVKGTKARKDKASSSS